MRKADLLDACAAKGGNETSKQEAFSFLKGFFVKGPERARRMVEYDLERKAENVFRRAKAGYDDVDKEELLEACMNLGLEGATTKKGAYDLLVEREEKLSDPARNQPRQNLDWNKSAEELAQIQAQHAAEGRGADAYDNYGKEYFDPALQAEGEEEA